ncbi:MAG: hypothetical protein WDN49_15630 [Acetobacteraceae bacterium]
MTYPKGTVIRNTVAARVNHWITGGCFVLLLLSGLVDVSPAAVLALRPVRRRPMDAGSPSLDRGACCSSAIWG